MGDFTESTFEAYGFGGASFVINVLTDNGNRATSDVKSTVNRRNAKIAEMGSVIFLYDRRGKVEVAAPVNEEALMDAAIEAGVDDFEMLPVREHAQTMFSFVIGWYCSRSYRLVLERCVKDGPKLTIRILYIPSSCHVMSFYAVSPTL